MYILRLYTRKRSETEDEKKKVYNTLTMRNVDELWREMFKSTKNKYVG